MAKEKERENDWPQLLTIPKAAETAGVTKHMLRTMAKEGTVVSVKSGNVCYINMDSLNRVLKGEEK